MKEIHEVYFRALPRFSFENQNACGQLLFHTCRIFLLVRLAFVLFHRKCTFFSTRVSDFESRVTFNKEAAAAALLEVEAVREAVAEAEQKTAEAR